MMNVFLERTHNCQRNLVSNNVQECSMSEIKKRASWYFFSPFIFHSSQTQPKGVSNQGFLTTSLNKIFFSTSHPVHRTCIHHYIRIPKNVWLFKCAFNRNFFSFPDLVVDHWLQFKKKSTVLMTILNLLLMFQTLNIPED